MRVDYGKGPGAIPKRATTSNTKGSSKKNISSSILIDAASLKIFSKAVAETLENALTPLQQELAELRETIQELKESGNVASSPSPSSRRADAPEDDAELNTACQVAGCPAPVLAKELCETHYRIMRRSLSTEDDFDLRAQRPARVRKAERACEHAGCEEAHYAKDLCRRHYMAARSRIRNAERQTGPAARLERSTAGAERLKTRAATSAASMAAPSAAPASSEPDVHSNGRFAAEEQPQATGAQEADAAELLRKQESLRRELGGSSSLFDDTDPMAAIPDGSLPTAEVVSRVVAQYRGGLDRVAEVLGRNKRTLIDLLDHLDLMPYVARVRGAERQRVEGSSLRERLNDLLFREKLLEDLGCLKEIDERTSFEVKMRCAEHAKNQQTVEDALLALASEFRLEEAGMKRLIWRYDLRRYLRGLNLKSTAQPRVRV